MMIGSQDWLTFDAGHGDYREIARPQDVVDFRFIFERHGRVSRRTESMVSRTGDTECHEHCKYVLLKRGAREPPASGPLVPETSPPRAAGCNAL